MQTRKDDELGLEAGPERAAPKFSISTCPVMEFDTYEEAFAFKTENQFATPLRPGCAARGSDVGVPCADRDGLSTGWC